MFACRNAKDVGALLRLSRVQALALPSPRISNSIAHAEIYWDCRIKRTECNTPNVDVSAAYLLGDVQICEIWTPKITFVNVLFTNMFWPAHPFGLFESDANIRNLYECCIVSGRLFCKIRVFFLISAQNKAVFMLLLRMWKDRLSPPCDTYGGDYTRKSLSTGFISLFVAERCDKSKDCRKQAFVPRIHTKPECSIQFSM